jgi:hypothetical protein
MHEKRNLGEVYYLRAFVAMLLGLNMAMVVESVFDVWWASFGAFAVFLLISAAQLLVWWRSQGSDRAPDL